MTQALEQFLALIMLTQRVGDQCELQYTSKSNMYHNSKPTTSLFFYLFLHCFVYSAVITEIWCLKFTLKLHIKGLCLKTQDLKILSVSSVL